MGWCHTYIGFRVTMGPGVLVQCALVPQLHPYMLCSSRLACCTGDSSPSPKPRVLHLSLGLGGRGWAFAVLRISGVAKYPVDNGV